MRTVRHVRHAFEFLLLFGVAAHAQHRPRVMILGTGGTISGAQLSDSSRAYLSGAVLVQDLLQAIPQANKLANITAEQVCNIGSQNMTNTIWLQLAARVNEVVSNPNIDGIVITHGTDTVEETSYFLSLVVKSDKPIVLTAAVRPSTAIGADGPSNLYDAIAVAANPSSFRRGVLVTMNGDIHYAREVEKTNTVSLNAFASPNRGRAGETRNGDVTFFSTETKRFGLESEFSVGSTTVLPRVDIVYAYASLGRGVIDYLVQSGVNGIVVAGTGDGNVTAEAIAGLEDASRKGVVIVRSTRVGSGPVLRDVELDDDTLGFVVANDLNPQKARVLLLLALMETKQPKKLQAIFDSY
jgi:L-asparaginase